MAAYLPTVTDEISVELRDKIINDDDDVTTINKRLNKDDRKDYSYFLRRMAKMGEVWSKQCETVGWYSHQVLFLIKSAANLIDLCEYDRALESADNAVKLSQKYLADGRITDENLLASSFFSRAMVYLNLGKHSDALTDEKKCVSIREILFCENNLKNENDLSSAYTGRSIVYISLGDYEKAIDDIDWSIEIIEQMQSESLQIDESFLANNYFLRSISYGNKKQIEKAIDDSRRSIDLYEKLINSGNLSYEKDLASAYSQIAFLMNNYSLYYDGRKDLMQSIKIQEKLYNEGKLHNLNSLIGGYIKAAECSRYGVLRDYYIDKAFSLLEIENEKGKLYDLYLLAYAIYVKCSIIGDKNSQLAFELVEYGINSFQKKVNYHIMKKLGLIC